MDTTKENILMCEKAEEIQKLWDGQHFQNVVVDKRFHQLSHYSGRMDSSLKRYFIWLPHQDQLQEMLFEYKQKKFKEDLKDFRGVEDTKHCQQEIPRRRLLVSVNEEFNYYVLKVWKTQIFTSMEQLWLAFVMKEKYNKIWNGEKWKNV